jgi:hypothetical protein
VDNNEPISSLVVSQISEDENSSITIIAVVCPSGQIGLFRLKYIKNVGFEGIKLDVTAFNQSPEIQGYNAPTSNSKNKNSIQIRPGSNQLAVKLNGAVFLYDYATKKITKHVIKNLTSMCLTSDGQHMVCATQDGDVIALPIVGDGKFGTPKVDKFAIPNNFVTSLAANTKIPNQICAGASNGHVYVYNFH